MLAEVNSTIIFLSELLKQKSCLTPENLRCLCERLESTLTEHYANHWFPDKPMRGSGYRCIRINGILDPIVARAVKLAGLAQDFIHRAFPEELTIWVDPGEVVYRIGEHGSLGRIYPPGVGVLTPIGQKACNNKSNKYHANRYRYTLSSSSNANVNNNNVTTYNCEANNDSISQSSYNHIYSATISNPTTTLSSSSNKTPPNINNLDTNHYNWHSHKKSLLKALNGTMTSSKMFQTPMSLYPQITTIHKSEYNTSATGDSSSAMIPPNIFASSLPEKNGFIEGQQVFFTHQPNTTIQPNNLPQATPRNNNYNSSTYRFYNHARKHRTNTPHMASHQAPTFIPPSSIMPMPNTPYTWVATPRNARNNHPEPGAISGKLPNNFVSNDHNCCGESTDSGNFYEGEDEAFDDSDGQLSDQAASKSHPHKNLVDILFQSQPNSNGSLPNEKLGGFESENTHLNTTKNNNLFNTEHIKNHVGNNSFDKQSIGYGSANSLTIHMDDV